MNNKNNNPFDLPKRVDNDGDLPSLNQDIKEESSFNNQVINETLEEDKPIIEIPQSYYDKLAQEKMEKEQKEEEERKLNEQFSAFHKEGNKIFSMTIFNALIFFCLLYLAVNYLNILMVFIPVIIIVVSIIEAIKNKEKTNYPVSVLLGGMLVAVVTFVISMINTDEMDLWTYYAIAGAVIAFLGLIIANIVTKFVVHGKEIKALETVGYVIFFACLVGIPFFFYQKYPEAFYRYVFLKQAEVKAETEEEFIIKTLKLRYNLTFTCDNSNVKTSMYNYTQTVKSRTCSDEAGNEFTVQSVVYDKSENKYIVLDTYMDTLYLESVKESLTTNVKAVISNPQSVLTYLYPQKECRFVGDCVEVDEYFELLEEESDLSNQYNSSTELNLEKYLSGDAISFVNDYKFKVVLNVFVKSETELGEKYCSDLVLKILDVLNDSGIKNTYGYRITINRYSSTDVVSYKEYEVISDASTDGTFADPQVVE